MKFFISLIALFFIISCSDNSNSSDKNDLSVNENDSIEIIESKTIEKPEKTKEEEDDEITFDSWLTEIPEAPHLDSIMDSEYISDIMYFTKLEMAMPYGSLTKFITVDTIYVYGQSLHYTSNCDADVMQLFSPEGVLYEEYITERRCADDYQTDF